MMAGLTPDPYKRDPADWDRFHMGLAERVALLSKDPDRKVGAVLVTSNRRHLSIGYNGFSASCYDSPAHLKDRAFKLANMVHAEVNCLQQSPFNPVGCSMFVTRFPCAKCAQRIVFARVARVVAPTPDLTHPRWGMSWAGAIGVLSASGIELSFMEIGK